MKAAYELVNKITKKSQERQKEIYDRRTTNAEIQLGDRVLVKIVAFDGKHKIADKWEEEPYLVIEHPNPEIPVYKVQKETTKGKTRTLHRNLLLPIGHLDSYKTSVDETSPSTSRPTPKPRTRQTLKKKQGQVQEKIPEIRESENDKVSSDEETEESDTEFIPVPVSRIPVVNIPVDVSKHPGEPRVQRSEEQRVQRSEEQRVQSPREQRVLSPKEQIVHSPREQPVQRPIQQMDHIEESQEREQEIQHHDAEEEVTEQRPVETEQQQEHAEASSTRSEEEEPLPVIPRRSNRERRKPDRLTPQEFVLVQQQQQQEWMKKCDYLHHHPVNLKNRRVYLVSPLEK
ncbi:adenylate cyclase, terminal-differentiation specific-like [Saccostrea cucullata]|uniref:adenylate cyclase, terminal-differentiation specific-like n=1 Tax=Saccostrea cuccullata TaxID=36930 RepID=UPI002ECFCA44